MSVVDEIELNLSTEVALQGCNSFASVMHCIVVVGATLTSPGRTSIT